MTNDILEYVTDVARAMSKQRVINLLGILAIGWLYFKTKGLEYEVKALKAKSEVEGWS